MKRVARPSIRPARPHFSSGPCAKRPGWELAALQGALVGRSHRSKPGRARLREVIDRSRELLEIPDDYRVGIVPASDTGAVEMALWSLVGARPVDVLAWESFGKGWVRDVLKELEVAGSRALEADYGELPDLAAVDFEHDVVFTWNGTTSGVCVPDGNWIPSKRGGLVFCDATSAVFAMDLPFEKLDVVTWSWQKVLGGEGAHGMLVLSPRAVEGQEGAPPPRPLPKIFRMTRAGALDEKLFLGDTINTPSMLCVEDALDALRWAESVGGVSGMVARSTANLAVLEGWVAGAEWVDFLAARQESRSSTSVCLKIVDPWFESLDPDAQASAAKQVVSLLEEEGVAYDIGAYRDAPPGLRIWGGATVEASDVEALCPWLDWAFAEVRAEG